MTSSRTMAASAAQAPPAARKYRLAVMTVEVGAPSETFIRRHMEDLLPGETVVVTGRDLRGDGVPSPFPCLVTRPPRKDFGWLLQSARYLGGLSRLRPTEAAVAKYLSAHGATVILSEYLNASLQWLPVAQVMGLPFFAHAHGYDVSKYLRMPQIRDRYLEFEAAAGVITMSRVSRDRLVELGLSAGKIHVIPYGVDVPPVLPARTPRAEVRCLAVGRMVAKKAPLLLLQAFREALDAHGAMTLDFVGDGPFLDEVRRLIASCGLQDRVILHGARPNAFVQRLMKESDVFLQHSRTDPDTGDEEGMPVAILEAMANGLPVIATRHAGIPEAVSDGVTGVLVEEGDVHGMAEQIARLAGDPDARKHLGNAGWRRAGECFTWQRQRTELLQLLGLGPPAVREAAR